MAKPYPEPEVVEAIGSAWAAPPGRFPIDDRLRDFGFVIAERKAGKEARWRYRREVFPQSDCLDIIDAMTFGAGEDEKQALASHLRKNNRDGDGQECRGK